MGWREPVNTNLPISTNLSPKWPPKDLEEQLEPVSLSNCLALILGKQFVLIDEFPLIQEMVFSLFLAHFVFLTYMFLYV